MNLVIRTQLHTRPNLVRSTHWVIGTWTIYSLDGIEIATAPHWFRITRHQALFRRLQAALMCANVGLTWLQHHHIRGASVWIDQAEASAWIAGRAYPGSERELVECVRHRLAITSSSLLRLPSQAPDSRVWTGRAAS